MLIRHINTRHFTHPSHESITNLLRNTYSYMDTCTCIPTYTHACTHTSARVHRPTQAYLQMCVFVCVCVSAYALE